jgi:SOS-response transcriptional repressor LexA
MGKIQKAISSIIAERKKIGRLSQRDVAKALGCSQAAVSHMLSGARGLSEARIVEFCELLGITLGDLENPTPRPVEPKPLRDYLEKLKRLYEESTIPGFKNVTRSIDDWIAAAKEIAAAKNPPPESNIVYGDFAKAPIAKESISINYLDSDIPRPVEIFRVPHYDAIPAGNPRQMDPQGQIWMDVIHSSGKDTWYTLRVMGDSMSPEYLNGDIVLMDYALQPHDGDVVAALIDGTDSTLKIYSREGEEITLTPIETKRHSPRTYHASRVTIQGVLLEIVRRTARRKR